MNRTEFWKTVHHLWQGIDNNEQLTNTCAKDLVIYNKDLLKQVIEIHKTETDHDFKDVIEEMKVRKYLNHLNGTYSHYDLYFCDEDHDYYFIGDIHSDAFILEYILEKTDFFKKVEENIPFKLVFLGDYVDRGKHHLKTLQILLMLKVYFPDNIILLMGNHDIGKIENGEVTLYLRKVEEDMDYFYIYLNHLLENHPDFDQEIVDLYQDFMNNLNVAAFIMTKKAMIKAVHGGIPRPQDETFDYLSDFRQLTDDSVDFEDHRIRDCILWSDPSIQHNQPTLPMKRFKFYENQLVNYLSHLDIDLIVRGHQAVEEGHLHLFDKIHTIFSSGKIEENGENINKDTAYDHIPPKILYYNHKKGLPLSILELGDNQ